MGRAAHIEAADKEFSGRRAMIPADEPFAGRSILDLEAERAQLERGLEELTRKTPPPGYPMARGLARLELVCAEIRRGALRASRTHVFVQGVGKGPEP